MGWRTPADDNGLQRPSAAPVPPRSGARGQGQDDVGAEVTILPGRAQQRRGLVSGHGPGWPPAPTRRRFDQRGNVAPDMVPGLGTADGPDQAVFGSPEGYKHLT
jgi:hypothetical protein